MINSLILIGCNQEKDAINAFNDGDYETALVLWQQRAQDNDNVAQNYLGIHYHLGLGVDQNIRKAVEWYELAAKAGNPEAQRNLGSLYESGKLGKRDFEEAYVWLYAAYQQGNVHAAKTLETISGQLSPGRVRKLKQRAAPYIVNDIVDPENDDY